MSVCLYLGKKIFHDFISSLELFLDKNSSNLSGNDYHELYFEFWNRMKKSIGSSSNFTGVSEFLIFHTLKSMLGLEYKIEPIRELAGNDKDDLIRRKFHALSKNLIIGHEIPFWINGNGPSLTIRKGTICPDISIQYDNELRSIIEIKLYVGSKSDIETVFNSLIKIKQAYPHLKCLLIIYVKTSDPIKNALKEYEENYEWFSFRILQENNEKITSILNFINPLV